MDKPIKKINFVYLLCTIFIPLMLVSLGLTVGYFLFHDGGVGAVICFLVPPVLAFVWWSAGGCSTRTAAKKWPVSWTSAASAGTRPLRAAARR